MKLCIADPPYLGRSALLYGESAVAYPSGGMRPKYGRPQAGDRDPRADEWDDPESHRRLVERLLEEYDGFAIAMNPENLFDYLQWVPRSCRIGAWLRTNPFPAGHVVKSWEPVVFRIPDRPRDRALQARDAIASPKPNQSLVGAKPREWTRWVLDVLGYDPETDTVDDLFHGSGAVAAEIAQTVLDFGDAS